MSVLDSCSFCAIVKGNDSKVREVARNSEVVVIFPTQPAILGHCMVIPRRHVEDFSDLSDDEVQGVMLATRAMATSLKHSVQPDGINIIQSNGEAASQSVPHIHVHILPRWKNDPVGEIWPPESNYLEEDKDRVLAQLRAATNLPDRMHNPEDIRQHLSFVQNIISRMAQSSSSTKGWLLPVVTAAYGYAFTKPSVAVAVLGIMATLVFGFLDIGYLRTERKYRELYEHIAARNTSIPPYSLNYRTESITRKTVFLEHWSVLTTWAIWPFYGALLLAGLLAIAMTSNLLGILMRLLA